MEENERAERSTMHSAAVMFILGSLTSSLLVLLFLVTTAWFVDGASEHDRRARVESGRSEKVEPADGDQYQCQ